MKRRLFLLALLAIVIGFCTTSCKEKIKANSDIANTQWTASFTEYGTTLSLLLYIRDNNKFSFSATIQEGGITETIQISGTYTYKSPNITFVYNDEGDWETFTGTVAGNKLTLNESELSDSIVLTKN